MPTRLEPIDLSKIAKRYRNKWIALSEDLKKVYASGDGLREVQNKAIRNGHPEAIITKLPDPDACLIF